MQQKTQGAKPARRGGGIQGLKPEQREEELLKPKAKELPALLQGPVTLPTGAHGWDCAHC